MFSTKENKYIAMFIVATSCLLGFYSIAFLKVMKSYPETDLFGEITFKILNLMVIAAALFVVLLLIAVDSRFRSVWRRLYDCRVCIGVLIVVLCTVLEISGSSIGMWAINFGGDYSQGLVFGVPRGIRSDEWLVNTPFAISQQYTGYASVSALMRAADTDVTLVYAQPCWTFSTLFRPFLWGYLLFGSAKGLAFFWSARLVVLFLVSTQMGEKLTNGSRCGAIAFGIFVAFSPVVQWWFAVNGIAELFIFGQGLVLALDGCLAETLSRKNALRGLFMGWMGTCFVLVLYPAWQVPLFWIFFAMGLACILEHMGTLGKKHIASRLILPLCLMGLVVAISVLASFIPVKDVYETVSNTVYPGQRVINGGGGAASASMYGLGIFGSLNDSAQTPNASEAAGFFALCPLGCCAGMLKLFATQRHEKKIDFLCLVLLLVEVLLLVYSFVGLNPLLATVTLLSRSGESRVMQVVGYADLVFLFHVASNWHTSKTRVYHTDSRHKAISFVVIDSLLLALFYVFILAKYGMELRIAYLSFLVVYVALFIAAFLYAAKCESSRFIPILMVSLVIFASGFTANPIYRGIEPLISNEIYQEVKAITSQDSDALWATDNSFTGQLCLAAGAATVNSVNTYPVLERWALLDDSEEAKDIYNRYAHTTIYVSDSTAFVSTNPDRLDVTLTLDQLKEIDVTYYMTINSNLDSYSSESTKAALVNTVGIYYIWRIE